jgi:hypothetical protein
MKINNAFFPSENRKIVDKIKSTRIPVTLNVENKDVIATFSIFMLREFLEQYESRKNHNFRNTLKFLSVRA